MAPDSLEVPQSLKRTAIDAGYEEPASSKRRVHHSVCWQQDTAGLSIATQHDDELIDSLLIRSIILALEAVGFRRADPAAVEGFRAEVEEYMSNFLASVRKSMLSCRRIQAIPQDFLYALSTHQLTLRSLLPHLNPPIPPKKTQPILAAQPVLEHENQDRAHVLTTILADSPAQGTLAPQIPPHFPRLPGKHTYQFEETYMSRETDPRKIRERATEEGRLGEGALRKLVSVHVGESPTISSRPRNYNLPIREQGRALWKATMQAIWMVENEDLAGRVTDHELKGMETGVIHPSNDATLSCFGSIVNAERRYWRKGAMQKNWRLSAHGDQVDEVT